MQSEKYRVKDLKESHIKHSTKKGRTGLVKYRVKLTLKVLAFFLIISVVGTAISIAIFFKVEDIEVRGESRYTGEQIIDSSKVKKGQNLVLLNLEEVKEKIEKELPFIKVNDIKKYIPNKLIIKISEAEKYACIEQDGIYVLFNKDKRIMQIDEEMDKDLLKIKGVNVLEPKVGEMLNFQVEDRGKSLYKILDLLLDNNLKEMSEIDLSLETDIRLNFQSRVDILLGNLTELEYKIRTASEIINNRLRKDEKGELDVSMLDKGNSSYFRPKGTVKS